MWHSAQCQIIVMLSVVYAECHLCWVSLMLSVTYVECHLCWVSLMLNVTCKPFMLSVIMLSVVAPIFWQPIYLEQATYLRYLCLPFLCFLMSRHILEICHSLSSPSRHFKNIQPKAQLVLLFLPSDFKKGIHYFNNIIPQLVLIWLQQCKG